MRTLLLLLLAAAPLSAQPGAPQDLQAAPADAVQRHLKRLEELRERIERIKQQYPNVWESHPLVDEYQRELRKLIELMYAASRQPFLPAEADAPRKILTPEQWQELTRIARVGADPNSLSGWDLVKDIYMLRKIKEAHASDPDFLKMIDLTWELARKRAWMQKRFGIAEFDPNRYARNKDYFEFINDNFPATQRDLLRSLIARLRRLRADYPAIDPRIENAERYAKYQEGREKLAEAVRDYRKQNGKKGFLPDAEWDEQVKKFYDEHPEYPRRPPEGGRAIIDFAEGIDKELARLAGLAEERRLTREEIQEFYRDFNELAGKLSVPADLRPIPTQLPIGIVYIDPAVVLDGLLTYGAIAVAVLQPETIPLTVAFAVIVSGAESIDSLIITGEALTKEELALALFRNWRNFQIAGPVCGAAVQCAPRATGLVLVLAGSKQLIDDVKAGKYASAAVDAAIAALALKLLRMGKTPTPAELEAALAGSPVAGSSRPFRWPEPADPAAGGFTVEQRAALRQLLEEAVNLMREGKLAEGAAVLRDKARLLPTSVTQKLSSGIELSPAELKDAKTAVEAFARKVRELSAAGDPLFHSNVNGAPKRVNLLERLKLPRELSELSPAQRASRQEFIDDLVRQGKTPAEAAAEVDRLGGYVADGTLSAEQKAAREAVLKRFSDLVLEEMLHQLQHATGDYISSLGRRFREILDQIPNEGTRRELDMALAFEELGIPLSESFLGEYGRKEFLDKILKLLLEQMKVVPPAADKKNEQSGCMPGYVERSGSCAYVGRGNENKDDQAVAAAGTVVARAGAIKVIQAGVNGGRPVPVGAPVPKQALDFAAIERELAAQGGMARMNPAAFKTPREVIDRVRQALPDRLRLEQGDRAKFVVQNAADGRWTGRAEVASIESVYRRVPGAGAALSTLPRVPGGQNSVSNGVEGELLPHLEIDAAGNRSVARDAQGALISPFPTFEPPANVFLLSPGQWEHASRAKGLLVSIERAQNGVPTVVDIHPSDVAPPPFPSGREDAPFDPDSPAAGFWKRHAFVTRADAQGLPRAMDGRADLGPVRGAHRDETRSKKKNPPPPPPPRQKEWLISGVKYACPPDPDECHYYTLNPLNPKLQCWLRAVPNCKPTGKKKKIPASLPAVVQINMGGCDDRGGYLAGDGVTCCHLFTSYAPPHPCAGKEIPFPPTPKNINMKFGCDGYGGYIGSDGTTCCMPLASYSGPPCRGRSTWVPPAAPVVEKPPFGCDGAGGYLASDGVTCCRAFASYFSGPCKNAGVINIPPQPGMLCAGVGSYLASDGRTCCKPLTTYLSGPCKNVADESWETFRGRGTPPARVCTPPLYPAGGTCCNPEARYISGPCAETRPPIQPVRPTIQPTIRPTIRPRRPTIPGRVTPP